MSNFIPETNGQMLSVRDILDTGSGGRRLEPPQSVPQPASGDLPPKPRIIVYDLEIKRDPAECLNGWDGVRRGEAGVSCVGVYDNVAGQYGIYDHEHLEECVTHLNTADALISFNGIEFDTPVLQSVTGLTIMPYQYDVLHEIWKAMGTREKGYKLGEVCGRLELGSKISNGENAVKLFAEDRLGELWGYCLNDVRLTRRLARFIWSEGYVLTPDMERLDIARLEI